MSLHFQSLAVLSTGLYFTGQVYFKIAATDMPTLAGDRPWQLARVLLSHRTWCAGAAIIAVGACVQTVSLTRLSLVEAEPMFLAGLGVLFVLAMVVMGERLTPREWSSVVLLAVAAALFT